MRQNRNRRPQVEKEFMEKVIQVNRVSKKTKGGNNVSFTTLIVVGDKKGRVGVAMGKAPDVLSSIKKGVRRAKKNLIRVPIDQGTIPFALKFKRGAAKVYLKPAPNGSGIIAGGAVRAVVEAAGITDIVGKILGSNNQINNVYATYEAMKEMRRLVKVKGIKLKETKKSEPLARKDSVNNKSVNNKRKTATKPGDKATATKKSLKKPEKTTTSKSKAVTKPKAKKDK